MVFGRSKNFPQVYLLFSKWCDIVFRVRGTIMVLMVLLIVTLDVTLILTTLCMLYCIRDYIDVDENGESDEQGLVGTLKMYFKTIIFALLFSLIAILTM